MCICQSQSPNLPLCLPFPPWCIFKLHIRGIWVRETFQRWALSAGLCFLISSPIIDGREWKRIRKQVLFMCACVLAHTHTHTRTRTCTHAMKEPQKDKWRILWRNIMRLWKANTDDDEIKWERQKRPFPSLLRLKSMKQMSVLEYTWAGTRSLRNQMAVGALTSN